MKKMTNEKPTILCIDAFNLLHKTYYIHAKDDPENIIGLAYHATITTLNKYFKQLKPQKVILAFDRMNWRKIYTQSEECISKKTYKGQRRKNMTPRERERYEKFLQFVSEFEQMIREHTGIVALSADLLEADDILSGIVQKFHLNHNISIISADKDLIQLLRYPNTSLIDPSTGKKRTLTDWDDNVDYFLFLKCIRGDISDNVQSAFPRVRTTKIKEAFEDLYIRVNFMNETWTDHTGTEYTVGQLFRENELLMDLTKQPSHVKELIDKTIVEGLELRGKFSFFHFVRFLGNHGLKNIHSQLNNFTDLLQGEYKKS